MAALTLTACDTTYLCPEGGTKIQLTGTFTLNTALQVYVGTTACYSGIRGQGNVIYPLQATLAVAFTPVLLSTLTTASLTVVSGVTTITLTNQFIIQPNAYYSAVYNLRGILPPTWAVGPRSIGVEVPA